MGKEKENHITLRGVCKERRLPVMIDGIDIRTTLYKPAYQRFIVPAREY